MISRLRLALACGVIAATTFAAVPETLILTGTITNTTHDVSGPARFELTFEGDTLRGFLSVEAPLLAGRWPVTGTRQGAWCELACQQSATTRTIFRGVLSSTELRGTYVYGGNGELVQYGRFRAAVARVK